MYMTNKKRTSFTIAGIGLIIVALIVGLFIYHQQPKPIALQYHPIGACQAFTKDDAKTILGSEIIGGDDTEAVLSGDTATSKCAYTDKNLDNMAALGIAIRTGVRDAGVQKNKDDFAASRAANTVEDVPALGEAAFYNKTSGMLNIRDGIVWIMINYTVGGELTGDSQQKAVQAAQLIMGDNNV